MKSLKSYLYNFFGSSKMMMLYLLLLIVLLAVATFMDAGEAVPPSNYTNDLIFQKWWFELIFVLLAINFFVHIFKYKLIKRKMWSTLFLHLSFVVIIIGAGVTRYFGYEGMMNIREGEESNTFYSLKPYLQSTVETFGENNAQRFVFPAQKALLSPRQKKGKTFKFGNESHQVNVETVQFFDNATIDKYVDESQTGEDFIKIVENSSGERNEHYIKYGENIILGKSIISFSDTTQLASVNIFKEGNDFFVYNRQKGSIQNMVEGTSGTFESGEVHPLQLLNLYSFGENSFVIPEPVINGVLKEKLVQDDKSTKYGAEFLVSDGSESKNVIITAPNGGEPTPVRMKFNKKFIYLTLGSTEYKLPYSIRLNDFVALKYPGTDNAYKSFKSQVTVFDDLASDEEIYMNHILNYKGYRFFQTSFDKDEQGTFLSVNHDFWGSLISYIGYSLLFTAMICIFFDKPSRTQFLLKKLKEVNVKKSALLIAFAFSFINISNTVAQDSELASEQAYETLLEQVVDKETGDIFGHLVIQDENGRMKPVNTYGSELLRKISKKGDYKSIDANQALLSFVQYPEEWVNIKLIKLKKGNPQLREILEIPIEDDYASLNDFYTPSKELKIPANLIEDASTDFIPTQFEKDILRAFQYQYLLARALSGELYQFFPVPNDEKNTWVSYAEMKQFNLPYFQGDFRKVTTQIFEEQKHDTETIRSFITQLETIQKQYGADVRPSDTKINAEVKYNELYIFKNLMIGYLLVGLLLIIFAVIDIFEVGKWVKVILSVLKWILIAFTIIHLGGMLFRWYISGHAPWSDAYEAIVYVGFMTMLFGIILGKKSNLIIGAGAFVASMILFIAHLNFVDPAIANLVPVLDSYWLMIHVAIIVASYGPFSLSMILGVLYLIISIIPNTENNQKLKLAQKEITIVNELSITIGVVLLTIGNFLGAMWANESWGRYWGWDPKETWALISILVYSVILHFRLIPGLKSKLTLNIASIYGYYSILMTFFGVNFYLTGLHSYASGDKIVTPKIIWISLALLTTLVVIVLLKNKSGKKTSNRVSPSLK